MNEIIVITAITIVSLILAIYVIYRFIFIDTRDECEMEGALLSPDIKLVYQDLDGMHIVQFDCGIYATWETTIIKQPSGSYSFLEMYSHLKTYPGATTYLHSNTQLYKKWAIEEIENDSTS